MLKSISLSVILTTLLFATSCSDQQIQNEVIKLKTENDQLKTKLATAKVNEAKPGFIHTVYFYAAEGLTEQRKTEFMTGLAELAKTPSIQKVYYGPPAGTDREIVDNSYLVAWICHFDSAADQDAYQKDPIHLKFIEDYQDVWGKVLIYDNLLVE